MPSRVLAASPTLTLSSLEMAFQEQEQDSPADRAWRAKFFRPGRRALPLPEPRYAPFGPSGTGPGVPCRFCAGAGRVGRVCEAHQPVLVDLADSAHPTIPVRNPVD